VENRPDNAIVLLVEDEWLVRMEMADALTEAGFAVIEAGSGEAALDLLARGQHIDLLVTDIRLGGGISGWNVAAVARDGDPNLPVVYASANPPDKARMVEGSAFLDKPSRTDLLLSTCARLLAECRSGGTVGK